MKKVLLTQKGILALQATLYALPDAKLSIEVLSLRTDFKLWIRTKFELTSNERSKLDQMSMHLIEYAAIKSSNFLAQRKPIQFSIVEFKAESAQLENPLT